MIRYWPARTASQFGGYMAKMQEKNQIASRPARAIRAVRPSMNRNRDLRCFVQAYGQLEIWYGYGRPLKASTQAEMCVKPRSGRGLMMPYSSTPASNARALIGAPSALLNLLTSANIAEIRLTGRGRRVGRIDHVAPRPRTRTRHTCAQYCHAINRSYRLPTDSPCGIAVTQLSQL